METTTWDLSRIYKDTESFEKDLTALKKIVDEMASYKGKLSEEESLKAYLSLERQANELLEHLYMFAGMQSDRDKKNVSYTETESKVILVLQDMEAKTSFESPELIALGKEHLDGFLQRNPDFNDFSFIFEKLFHGQKYILSQQEEKLLSCFGPILGEGGELYSKLSVGDYLPQEATLSDGSKVKVSTANWTDLIANAKKPEDRQTIFETLYRQFDQHKNTYGEIYNLTVQSQLSEMKSRGYSSILQEHLSHNAIPESVFLNLVDVASTHTEALHKYYRLRQKALGLEKHRSYDRFLPLAKSDKKFSYEEAKELFFQSISSFPEDFQNKAREVLKPGYVDVYPSEGKRSGAYSNGGANVHPYILLNFLGNLDDVFTLAHESGHSIHTLYAEENQPPLKQGYAIFVAEIASTFNEHNLLDYLLSSDKLNREDKIALLQKAIDQIVSTFYRQTLFGQYEYEISQLAEKGEPINYSVLSAKMVELYKTYYGIDISEEKVKPLVWAYIPHLFYTPFYVYQYATSFTSSMLIYEKVKNHEHGAFENYIKMLSSGGSDWPIEEVKLGGVDLTTNEPFLSVTKRMEELVDDLEKLLNE